MASCDLVALTHRGVECMQDMADELSYNGWHVILSAPERLARHYKGVNATESLKAWCAVAASRSRALIMVGPLPETARAIGPYLPSPAMRAAVLAIDDDGLYAVPLAQGRYGDGTELADTAAAVLGSHPVVTAQATRHSLFAVDVWAAENHCIIPERELIREYTAAVLEGRTVGIISDIPIDGPLPPGLTELSIDDEEGRDECDLGIYVSFGDQANPFPRTLHVVPQALTVGLRCASPCLTSELLGDIAFMLKENCLSVHAVRALSCPQAMEGDQAVEQAARQLGARTAFHSPAELERGRLMADPAATGPLAPIDQDPTEMLALLPNNRLVIPHQNFGDVSLAVGCAPIDLAFPAVYGQTFDDLDSDDADGKDSRA